jgi:hypothetical protein
VAVSLRYDRDPDNHPEMPEHKHLPPDERIDSGPVSLRDVLDELNGIIYEIESEEEEEEEEDRAD